MFPLPPLLGFKLFHEVYTFCCGESRSPIHTSRLLSCVILRDPAHGQDSGGPGPHQFALQIVDYLHVATIRGFVDALLKSVP